MNEIRRNVMVGLFVLAGMTAMGVLVILFGQDTSWFLSKQTYALNIRFESASGIRPGTVVTIGGIPVGRVREAGFLNWERPEEGVNVAIQFDRQFRDLRLRRGTRAETIEPGMGMGRPPIELLPGPVGEPLLESGASIKGRMASAVETLIPPSIIGQFDKTATLLGDAAQALTPVLRDLHELLTPREPEAVDRPGGPVGNFSSSIARLDGTLRHFNTVLGDPAVQSNLKSSVENIHTITVDGKQLAADLKVAAAEAKTVMTDMRGLIAQGGTTMTTVNTNVEQVSRALLTNLEALSAVLTDVQQIAGAANRGEGTLGRFVRDERLYEAMVLTFRRLAETTEQFNVLVQEWQKGKIKVGF